MSYNKEGLILVTRRRPHKKQESHPYPKEQHKQNIRRYPKKKKKKTQKKQDIVQVDNFLVQKLITPVTLGEYFPLEFFNRRIMTSTYMVSCHKNSEEYEPSEDEENIIGIESSKTKEEDEVVVNLQCLLSFFGIYEMLQLYEKTQIALIQIHRNPSLYATKIKRAKQFENKCHNCATITFTSDDEENMTLNFIIIVFKPRHSNDAP